MFGLRRRREPPSGPFYKQRGWVSAVMFLGFVLVMSLIALVAGPEIEDDSEKSRKELDGVSGPLSPGDPQQVRDGRDGRPRNCRTDDGDQEQPRSAPTDVTWRKRVALMVPVSPKAGPLRTDEPGMWWCFARTPTGAVMAAHLIPVQVSGADWRTAAEQQIVPGKERDMFVTAKARAGASPPTEVGRFVGFSLDSYSRGAATVRLLLTRPSGGYLSTSVSLRWRDGDWKVALQEGSLYSPAKQGQPDGFAMWGAARG
ncbi:hypothetical protein GCM10009801_12370 [Streptomyces albiaxialis]|uniref:DUF8175 domain-containing protein n=1 Tax=Streptomyces albiaxialis TaxID=329523 RepID=A0ABN2VMI3_9ACTN